MFIDDNFAGNPDWTKRFLNEIKPMKLKWNATVSINAASDPQLLFNLLYRKYGKFTDMLCKMITYRRIGVIAQFASHYLKGEGKYRD